MDKPQWKIGLFAMDPLTLVRIEKGPHENGMWSVDLFHAGDDITEPCKRVGFSARSEADLRRVADPVMVLRALLTGAHEDRSTAMAGLADADKRIEKLSYALNSIASAQQIAAAEAKPVKKGAETT